MGSAPSKGHKKKSKRKHRSKASSKKRVDHDSKPSQLSPYPSDDEIVVSSIPIEQSVKRDQEENFDFEYTPVHNENSQSSNNLRASNHGQQSSTPHKTINWKQASTSSDRRTSPNLSMLF